MRVLICCSINWERSLRTSVLVGLCLTLAGGGVLGACSSGKDLQTLPTSGVFDYQLEEDTPQLTDRDRMLLSGM